MNSWKGCWTCTARKVQCDKAQPSCQKCSRSGRECQGYESRLSWPRDDDKKRAITAHVPSPGMRMMEPLTNLFFVNTTSKDVELYARTSLQADLDRPETECSGLCRYPNLVGLNHMDIVNHFYDSAYLSLLTFGVNPSRLRDILLCMAKTDGTVTNLAVSYALLAFSLLHLRGSHQQAIKFKLSALYHLSASAKQGSLSVVEAAQHVAAAMLLGAFELLTPSHGLGEWLWYIRGALNVVEAASLNNQSHGSDMQHLIDWLHYHDILSHFAIHYKHPQSWSLIAPYVSHLGPHALTYSSLMRHRPATPAPNPTYVITTLLSTIQATLTVSGDHWSLDDERQSRLKTLVEKIGNLPIMPVSTTFGADDAAAVQVYQMATRIGFIRASQSSWKQSTRMESLIDKIFVGPLPAHACGHFFPVTILACEACMDDQRTTILNVLDRAERSTGLRVMKELKYTFQSIWVQQDLHADSDLLLDYLGIMSGFNDV